MTPFSVWHGPFLWIHVRLTPDERIDKERTPMSSRHTLRFSALCLALLLAPDQAHAFGRFLGAVRNVANIGLPLASNIVSMIPGAGVALPFLQGAQSIANGGIAQGVGQIVSAGIQQGQMGQGGGGLPPMMPPGGGQIPTSFNGGGTSIAGLPGGGAGSPFANLPPSLGGNGPPLLPGNAALTEVDKLQDQVDDLTDLVEELKEELKGKDKDDEDEDADKEDDEDADEDEDDEETSDTADKVVGDAEDDEDEDKDDGVPSEDSVLVK
jgi:hypothetical protein